ncbi:MAG: glycoside hydrolase family 65 protein [Acidimicrobiia bacterium]
MITPKTNELPDGSEWWFGYKGFAPAAEGRREALCALGNGVFATRGSAPESTAGGDHYPGTYAAGFYNRLVSQVEGLEVEHESIVNLPDWLGLSFRPVGGDWLDLSAMHVAGYDQHLDLRRGVLHRTFTVTGTEGRTTRLTERRLVNMATPHLAALEWTITPLDWFGPMEIRSGVDGSVENRNVTAELDLASRHLTDLETGTDAAETVWISARTTQSQRHVTVAARTRLLADGAPVEPGGHTLDHLDQIEQVAEVTVPQGGSLTVDKVAAVATSLDHAIADTQRAALGWLADAASVDELVADHEQAWAHLWRRAHLELRSDDSEVARTLNLHTFHVLQTLSPHIVDRDVGVPARGLTGEGYRGHVFWDELFVFPYLNLRFPALTRELLLYRYRRLPAARRQARAIGCRGARFPWQSGSDGREETPTTFYNPRSGRWMPDNSRRQHHVSLAIAYELWQYHQVSGDDGFLIDYGAELLTEIARFWTDLAEHDPVTGRYHIRGVMGPDEFHDGYPDRPGQGIDDNAYTNVMVAWLLQRTCDSHQRLRDRAPGAWERLGVTGDEVHHWDKLSRRLHVPFHGDGIISQFAGYEDLAEFDWGSYRDRYGNIGRLDLILEAEGDTTNRYKAAKQADVLMLFYLFSADELTGLLAHLGYEFGPARIPGIVDYYTARMTHGSTLCRVAMAWVLARTDRSRSWNIFRAALASDVADIQGGTTREGIHLGAMAGTIDLVQRCYTGLETREDALWLDPRLPEELHQLDFEFSYRGQRIQATITGDRVELGATATTGRGVPVTARVAGRAIDLSPGERVVVELTPPQV